MVPPCRAKARAAGRRKKTVANQSHGRLALGPPAMQANDLIAHKLLPEARRKGILWRTSLGW
jgi:hypothetical protein